MSNLVPIAEDEDFVQGVVSHHGIKGMKWGVRRAESSLSAARAARSDARAAKAVQKAAANKVTVKTTSELGKAYVRTKGGSHQPATDDAVKAQIAKQKLKKSGMNSLTNEELQTLATRQNLENQVSTGVRRGSTKAAAAGFAKGVLKNVATQQATNLVNQAATTAGKDFVKKMHESAG